MKTYTLYFEFFGRKMKTTVEADGCQEAKDRVAGRLNFVSIYEDLPSPTPDPSPNLGGDGRTPRFGGQGGNESIFDLFKGFKK